ncbi:MAG: glucosyl-3-phosphoglycerate synthase [Chloroflexi bacterium]|nr:glucosyl-3-phosphoglycerate synthase [Chloroflexota bacterium]
MKRSNIPFPRHAIVPIVYGCEARVVVETAMRLATEVMLVGVVALKKEEALSAGAKQARELRKQLQRLADDDRVYVHMPVLVSHKPWIDLQKVIQDESPDLLLLEWGRHIEALSVTPADVLMYSPCDVALVRGVIPKQHLRVLAPVRGGPHAELAMRLAINFQPRELIALHIKLTGDAAASDAPFHGLQRVLDRLPDVQKRVVVTDDTTKTILDESKQVDLVVMGATARPSNSSVSLGPVADRVLAESQAAVLVVKTRRLMPEVVADESIGSQAISILVDKWFAENTFHADEFKEIQYLLHLKREQKLTVSLAMPALNEERTVGKVIRAVKRALMEKVPLLDEIVLIDSDSKDRTREIASKLGVPLYIHQQLLPGLGARHGKGEALWKSLLVTKGDIIVWIDTDIVNIHPRFVYGVVGPLLLNPKIKFVKGFYRRPLKVGGKVQAGGGGRVTELTARPLLNLFYPELSGVIQPLSGEYGGRRDALEQCAFFSGYGVETGLLIDIFEKYGLSSIAQVDLLERVHHSQPLEALSKMSFAIIQTVIRKLERHYERAFIADVNKTMKLVRYEEGNYFLDVEEIAERERPPMVEVEEYVKRRKK